MSNTPYTLKINKILWDSSEKQGYRNIAVSIDGTNIMCIVSHKCVGSWESHIVPMGYKHSKEQVLHLKEFYEVAHDIMKYLEKDSITEEEMQEYIGSL